MVYILKGGRSSTRALHKPSLTYEDHLLGNKGGMNMIERGALTDKDINFILDSKDKTLLKAFNKKFEREKKNSEHVKRVHGDAFDNVDNEGNLFKDRPAYDPATIGSTPEAIKEMKQILKTEKHA